jgi:ribonucleoside-diphosphate reductase alpha chain
MSETIHIPSQHEIFPSHVVQHSKTDSKIVSLHQDGENIDVYYGQDNLGKTVLQDKYLAPGEKSPADMWRRIAHAMAGLETDHEKWESRFYDMLYNFKFVPGGRIMHGAGRKDINSTLNNCYVVAIKNDSIGAIYDAIREEGRTYKYGGGCGHDLSVLRPKGSAINGTGGESCGPVGFMNLFSENTNTIAQHGRRGANMQTIRVDHPDISDFIDIKRDLKKVQYSNISVLLTHEFMEAVDQDSTFELKWGDEVYNTIQAKDLWMKINKAAHASAEPGIIFWDTMKDFHNAEYCSPLVSTNPCGEQPLPDGGACNLGAVNLARFVDENGNFEWDEFRTTVATGIRFLDNVIDYNVDRHALDIQKENALKDRRVGLGLLGLGDMLVLQGLKYGSDESLEIVEDVMKTMRDVAYETSVELAKEKGIFPNFAWEGYSQSKFIQNLPKKLQASIKKDGIRNATIMTVAPTGSGGIVAQVTSGIEPIFATSYKRRVKENSIHGDEFKEYKVVHNSLAQKFGSDEDLPSYVVTSHDIDPFERVKMQSIIQKYIDASISSTVNLPQDASVETVSDIYMSAYKSGLKGITVYREGSRDGILITDRKKEAPKSEANMNAEPPVLHPRTRPKETYGVTRRVRTGEGTLYITLNHDEEGLSEVFTTIGKAGGNAAAQAEAMSRLISLALRSGIDANEVIKQLKGISGPNPVWENGTLILSTPDAIGKAMENHLKEYPKNKSAKGVVDTRTFKSANTTITSSPGFDILGSESTDGEENTSKTMIACPECGATLLHESGCVTCHNCGYSRC